MSQRRQLHFPPRSSLNQHHVSPHASFSTDTLVLLFSTLVQSFFLPSMHYYVDVWFFLFSLSCTRSWTCILQLELSSWRSSDGCVSWSGRSAHIDSSFLKSFACPRGSGVFLYFPLVSPLFLASQMHLAKGPHIWGLVLWRMD